MYNLSLALQESIDSAEELSIAWENKYLGLEHILIMLFDDPRSFVREMIDLANVKSEDIIKEIYRVIKYRNKAIEKDDRFRLKYELEVDEVLIKAEKIAKKYNEDVITSEYLVLALLSMPNSCSMKKALCKWGITGEFALKFLEDYTCLYNDSFLFAASKVSETDEEVKRESKDSVLKTYSRDLIKEVKDNNIEVFGRDEEIQRIIEILCRKNKSNPILIGDAGVGKTSLFMGVAKMIAENKVPKDLKNKKLYLLDIFSLVAGSKYRGDFEDRAKRLLDEISGKKDIVLVIDEIHSMMGLGDNLGNADFSNMLKPALADGSISCIGASTVNEYQKYIECDPALSRRFQKVYVSEPDKEKTLDILKKVSKSYSSHHEVKFEDGVLEYMIDKTSEITNRRYPDKAIDLLDESCVKARFKNDKILDKNCVDKVFSSWDSESKNTRGKVGFF